MQRRDFLATLSSALAIPLPAIANGQPSALPRLVGTAFGKRIDGYIREITVEEVHEAIKATGVFVPFTNPTLDIMFAMDDGSELRLTKLKCENDGSTVRFTNQYTDLYFKWPLKTPLSNHSSDGANEKVTHASS